MSDATTRGPLQPHDGSPITIVVNGRPKPAPANVLSFLDIVALAFDAPPTGENVLFTITYRGGIREMPEGSVVENQKVSVVNKMIFNVTSTDKS